MNTFEEALKTIDYDHETGLLTWNDKAPKKVKGKPAIAKDGQGYVHLKLAGKMIVGHRIAWAKYYGELPNGQLDHINNVKSDNRICNLRIVTYSQNAMNKPLQKNNTTGYKGVTYHKASNKFHAKICANGKHYSLGHHETAELASQAYIKAQGELHGQYGRI